LGDIIRHFYYNSVWKCVEERQNSSTDPDRVYYWSARAGHRDELLRRDRSTSSVLDETLWCLMDYFDPIAITNSSGEVQERYSYSAFGLASILTPVFEPRTYSSFAWNFLFHGQFRDVDTTGWDNYGYRYYLPWLGRWPSRDPLGEIAGSNLYWLLSNDTINKTDYLGLDGPVYEPKGMQPNGSGTNTRMPNGRWGPRAPFGEKTPGVTPRSPTPTVPTPKPPAPDTPKTPTGNGFPSGGTAKMGGLAMGLQMGAEAALKESYAEEYNKGREQCKIQAFASGVPLKCGCCKVQISAMYHEVTRAIISFSNGRGAFFASKCEDTPPDPPEFNRERTFTTRDHFAH